MKKKITFVFSFMIATMFCFAGCSSEKSTDKEAASSSASETKDTITGTVEAVDTYTVSAPFSGLLLPFDIKTGQEVKSSDVLFTLDTVKVYSPSDGRVGSLKATAGDYTQAITSVYGALCYIQPDITMFVNASTENAYDHRENKNLNIGERLYIRSDSDNRINGEGTVISIDGSNYNAEVNWDGFTLDEEVSLYRESSFSDDSRVGSGKISRSNSMAIIADGYVLACHVTEDQEVNKGDLLFEIIDEQPENNSKGQEVISEIDGILTDISVTSGQQIQRGQELAIISDNSQMQVVIEADEMDMERLAVGDIVDIIIDSQPDKTYEGKVEYISSIGIQRQNATYYEVDISFRPDHGVMLGMSTTVNLR